jgi:hypothetical protein
MICVPYSIPTGTLGVFAIRVFTSVQIREHSPHRCDPPSSTDVVGWVTEAARKAFSEAKGHSMEGADDHYLVPCENRYILYLCLPLLASRERKQCYRLYKYIMMLNGDTAAIDDNADDTDPKS